jgi:hypothetical protein
MQLIGKLPKMLCAFSIIGSISTNVIFVHCLISIYIGRIVVICSHSSLFVAEPYTGNE